MLWNRQIALSVKKQRNQLSIFSSPTGYRPEFWKRVLSWLRDIDVHVQTINEYDAIFGKFDIVKDYILINHILLLSKYYIYS